MMPAHEISHEIYFESQIYTSREISDLKKLLNESSHSNGRIVYCDGFMDNFMNNGIPSYFSTIYIVNGYGDDETMRQIGRIFI